MSQKYIKTQNKNSFNQKSYGKYYAQPVYDQKFIETDEIADFIQTQATLKRSDIKASLDELGAAIKHFLELGQKIRLAGIGIFKVGFSSIGVNKKEDCTAATITCKVIQKYVNAKTLIKDVVFEETHDNTMNLESEESEQGGGASTGSETGGGSNDDNNDAPPVINPDTDHPSDGD